MCGRFVTAYLSGTIYTKINSVLKKFGSADASLSADALKKHLEDPEHQPLPKTKSGASDAGDDAGPEPDAKSES